MGYTVLMLAAFNGHNKSMKVLISAGADVNLKRKNGATALMTAVYRDQDECVYTLVRAGADVHLRDDKGYTALMSARELGRDKCVDILARAKDLRPELCLDNLCRDAIRKHLLQVSNKSLFDTVPTLPCLPHLLDKFLLFSEL